MGIVNDFQKESIELEALLACVGLQRRKGQERKYESRNIFAPDEDDSKLVCVTSGVSYLGLAIVKRLLSSGYFVRVIVHNQEDGEIVREMQASGEMVGCGNRISVVTADLSEFQSLVGAFDGCGGVFHTSAFTDPAGLSGYSKAMVKIEVKACENVMEACARTPTIRKCVLTSSLLACIWQNGSKFGNLSPVINHEDWSDEALCIEKKLWYALGKLRSEKAAWKIATDGGFKLTTICPGLISGSEFSGRNPTATTAYLKGAQEMYAKGLLATTDVSLLAEAHVCVYQAMNQTASGRYICFDHVIRSDNDAKKLSNETGLAENLITGNRLHEFQPNFKLSNRKMAALMARRMQHCFEEC